MTVLHWVFALSSSHVATAALGYYLHYRYGAKVAADVAKIKGVV